MATIPDPYDIRLISQGCWIIWRFLATITNLVTNQDATWPCPARARYPWSPCPLSRPTVWTPLPAGASLPLGCPWTCPAMRRRSWWRSPRDPKARSAVDPKAPNEVDPRDPNPRRGATADNWESVSWNLLMWCFFFYVLWLKCHKSGEVESEGQGHGRNFIFFGGVGRICGAR